MKTKGNEENINKMLNVWLRNCRSTRKYGIHREGPEGKSFFYIYNNIYAFKRKQFTVIR